MLLSEALHQLITSQLEETSLEDTQDLHRKFLPQIKSVTTQLLQKKGKLNCHAETQTCTPQLSDRKFEIDGGKFGLINRITQKKENTKLPILRTLWKTTQVSLHGDFQLTLLSAKEGTITLFSCPVYL